MKQHLLRSVAFTFTLLLGGGKICGQITFSSNLPIIVIDSKGAQIVDEPKIFAEMTVYWNPEEEVQRTDSSYIHYQGPIGIEIRGQSSQSFPKKGFGIETRTPEGEGTDVALLGFPEEEDWVIHSPYSDKSLMRNALAYLMAADIFVYAPRVKFCELILNGDYYGVILFTERLKRDKHRIDIARLRPTHNSGDQLTGGYIIRFDKFRQEELGWVSPYRPIPGNNAETRFILRDPKPEDITPEQRNYIRNYVTEFENALSSDRWREEANGYKRYIDSKSFIHMTLMTEISKNVDGYRLSTFMYKDRDSRGGKLTMGPVWDFNLAFGNANYCQGGEPTGWELDFNTHCPHDYWVNHFWWKRLMEDPEYVQLLRDEYFSLRNTHFSDERLMMRIDSMVTVLNSAQVRNFQRWPVLGHHVWPNRFVGNSHAEEIQYLKSWLTQRLIWLDDQIGKLSTNTTDLSTSVFKIFPNPTSDILVLDYPGADVLKIEIFNTKGNRTIHTVNVNQINVAELPAGIYYARMIINNQAIVKSFVKVD